MYQSFRRYLIALIVPLFATACQDRVGDARPTIDLSGEWEFSIDTGNIGIIQKWYEKELDDVIKLPGTTDLNQKGFLNTDTTTLHLNRVYVYEGPAWYRRKVEIPTEFDDKQIKFIIERTKSSKVWIDDIYIGESYLLQSPQNYDLSDYLSSGEHTITVRINNDLKLTPYGNVHIYTDETVTNWNGIIGDIFLEASPKTYIEDLRVTPDINDRKIVVKLSIHNGLALKHINVELEAILTLNGEKRRLNSLKKTVACDSILQIEYQIGDDTVLWDEYNQPLYLLTAVISNDSIYDRKSVSFGMRKFAVKGKQFSINGRTTFLRGKHDACVFPLTGHPPTNVEEWKRVYKKAKYYGINHYRFHSYCPPEAAFEAADQLGIYLQPELPFWGGLESDTIAAKLRDEGISMLKNYANHPSFVMFGPGNEIWSGHERVDKIIAELKDIDERPLYTMGANNNIGYVGPGKNSDFHIAVRTPYEHDTTLTHTRLTQAYVDSRDGGILNTQTPSTSVNYNFPVSQISVPMISHEIGQYQIYPDYKEIEKYTGVVRATNLEVFRNRLRKAGMLDQNIDFQKASGAWSAICYKAEMEAAFGTEKIAGFQLLDLQDFPGQGTALVGILDAFMDSKNVVSRDKWIESCNDVVILLEFPKYCWESSEQFEAKLKIANYSNKKIIDDIEWNITDHDGKQINSGVFKGLKVQQGSLENIGEIIVELESVRKAEKVVVNLKLKESGYSNSYPIWIYPQIDGDLDQKDIIIAEAIDESLIFELREGKKVLLFPTAESVDSNSVGGLFPPDFWNYGMFKGISEWAMKQVSPGTLGILTDPDHPIFGSFPTDFHTNWQWFSIIKASRPLILNETSLDYRPIVQVIDNLERNHKLGLIFEFAVGEGKLLVCMSRLIDILNNPEARQLYVSLLQYMNSDAFNPQENADIEMLYKLL